MVRHRRARSAEAKRERRDSLLDGVLRLLEDEAPSTITMSRIAASAGVTKGTVYLYFASRDEVYRALQGRELARWLGSLVTLLGGDLRHRGPRALAELVVEQLRRHPEVTRSLALAFSLGAPSPGAPGQEDAAGLSIAARRAESLLRERLYLAEATGAPTLVMTMLAMVAGSLSLPPTVAALSDRRSPAPEEARSKALRELLTCLFERSAAVDATDG